MENKKDDNGYNNESYLDKRVKPDDLQNIGVLDEIGNKTEEKSTNSSEKSAEIKSMKNIDDSKLADDQKEMHPEIVRKKNKDFTKPLILGIIVLIIVGIVAAYFLMPLINIQKKEDPQQIIKSAMQEMQKVKTYSYEGIIEFDVENKENHEGFNFDIELLGKADQTDVENIKAFNNIKIASDVDDDQRFSVDLDTVQIGQKKTYLKLNDFDFGVTGMIMGPQISPLKEKWYELDLEELGELSTASSGDVSGMNMMTYDVNKIMELYNKYELLKFEEDLGDVELGNIEAYHYKVKLDGVALANFYIDVLKEMTDEQDFDETSIKTYDMMFGEIEEGIKKYDYVINEITDNIDVEIWIGKKDKMIHKINLKGNYNEEYLSGIINRLSLSKAKAEAQDAAIKSAIQQVNINLIIYGDDNGSFEGYNLDSSGVSTLRNSEINIRTSENSYVIWAELAATASKWCCDSSGKVGFVLGDIKGTQCPDIIKKSQGEKNDTKLSFDISITMSDFNKPVEINEPEEVENLMKALEKTLEEFMRAGVTGGEIDTDADDLPDYMENIYGSDPNNPDTDGDGYTDGEEVESGYDPLIPGDAKLDYDKLFKTQ